MSWYVGIDPGVTGAIALLGPGYADVWDTPYAGGDYLGPEMRGLLAAAQGLTGIVPDGAPPIPLLVSIERVQIFHGTKGSPHASLKQGRGIGLWEGIVVGLGLPYELVEPRRWRATVGVPPKADKNASRMIAMRLFPQLAPQLQRVKDDGRADALLIAEAARRSREGATK